MRLSTTLKIAVVLTTILLSTSAVPTTWAQCQANELAKLTASDVTALDAFGHAVSICGDVVLIGAWNDYDAAGLAGSAYVYRFDGTHWAEEVKLLASDATLRDEFGVSVAVDGDVAVIGAHLDDDGGTDSGSAYVYGFDGRRWIEQGKLTASDAREYDNFGWAVAISGDVIVVGANLEDHAGPNSGAAYVFEKPAGGWTSMTETGKLIATDTLQNDEFGRSVAIDGDRIVVGAHYDSDGGMWAGTAYVFEKPVDGWGDVTETAKLSASDPTDQDRFGLSVSISGDIVLVGAWADDDGGSASGSVYVFEKPTGGWVSMTETTKLTASDAAAGDHFGWSVAIDGDIALIAAPAHLWDGSGYGSTYVYQHVGDDWIEVAKLEPSDGAEDDEFGYSVSIDGGTAAVGARYHATAGYDNAGASYVFRGLSDCNFNGTLDLCDIADGTSLDADGDGIPDECDCWGDLDGDGIIGLADLATLLANYDTPSGMTYADGDLDGDEDVDLADLAALLAVYDTVCD